MLWYASLVASLAVVGLAWDEEYPVYCDKFQPGPCLARLTKNCYDCVHAAEAQCPGTDKPFDDCFCPISSSSWSTIEPSSWSTIEKCFSDPTTGCNDGKEGPTSETFALLNTFAVECGEHIRNSLCNSDPQNLSPAGKELYSYQCK